MQNKELVIPEAKCGKYKQSLIEVKKWQIDYRKSNPPLFQFLNWLIGH